ncbi:MAG TPA: CHAT domain-containing tetratricopeptide repeat protein [Stellaceae bacterium]|jgi:CHAT domain-containing protein
MIGRTLRIVSMILGLFPGAAMAQTLPPPRSVADITAILDQEKPDLAKIAAQTRAADAQPTPGLSGSDLARFYAGRATAAAALGRVVQSTTDLQKAIDIARPSPGTQSASEGYLALLNLMRSIQSRAGNSNEAIALSKQLIALTEGQGAPSERTVAAYQTLITFTAGSGQLDEAKTQAQAMERVVDKLSQLPASRPNRAGDAWALDHVHGNIALASGRFDEAEADFRRAIPEGLQEAKDLASINVVVSRIWSAAASYSYANLAAALRGENRLAEAEIAARQGLLNQLEAQGRYAVETVDLISALSGILATEGRYGDATKLSQIAIDTYSAIGVEKTSRGLADARAALVAALLGQGKIAEALAQIDLIVSALANDRNYLSRILVANPGLVTTALRSGRAQDAAAWAQSAIDLSTRMFGANDERTAIQIGLYADALLASGDSARARANFAKAVPILLDTTNDSLDEGGQARIDRWRTFVLDGYLSLLVKDNTPDAAIEGFRIADAARGQKVQRAVAAAAARSAARDPTLAALTRREQDAQRQIDALTTTLANGFALPSGQRDDAALAKLRAQIDSLTGQRKDMRTQLARQFPQYLRLTDPKPSTVADTQKALRPGEALLAILIAPEHTYLWAVPQKGPPVFALSPLSSRDIDQTVKTLRAAVDPDAGASGNIPAFDIASAYKLYAGLVAPVKQGWGGAKDLFVVANGALGQIPFGMLATDNTKIVPDSAGQPLFAGYKTVPWLIRQIAITQLPTVTALTTLRTMTAAKSGRKPFIGFGDPWFSTAEAARALAAAKAAPAAPTAIASRGAVHLRSAPKDDNNGGLADLPRLPDTADEVKEVAIALKADPAKDVYLGAQANEQIVRTIDLDDRRVVMFATHGLIPGDLDKLTEPALALSAPDVAHVPGDGLLTVSKILGLKLNADWVVLSACNTAAGNGAGAEAVSGLGLAFFYAGSRAVLVSNWPVETVSARILTTTTFEREAASPGITRAEALRQAMLTLIDGPGAIDPGTRQATYSYAHPIFWAPFSLVGDGGAG